MAYEAYRVLKRFNWKGWEFAPQADGPCECDCHSRGLKCTGRIASDCGCAKSVCRCSCAVAADRFAGNIWVVESGNPRKETMMLHRFAVGDASIPPVDALLAQDQYRRLLTPWQPRELVGSRRK